MKSLKKVFYNIHSWIGIKLSILFFIVCLTGTLATLSHEMDWLFIPASRASPQKELASRNLIIKNLKNAYPNASVTYWLRHDEPYLADLIYKMENGKRTYVYANPYTGEIQGSTQLTFHRYFRDLHYFLFIPLQIGNFTVLIFGFLLLVSLITALFFYKKWWRKLFILHIGKGSTAFFKSAHKLIGLWSIPFSLLFSVTGIWYFIERSDIANVGELVNPKQPKFSSNTASKNTTTSLSYTIDYDKAVSIAQKAIPNLKVQGLNPPSTYAKSIYIRGTSDVPLVRQRANRVYINPSTYKVLKIQDAKNIPTIMWVNDIADPLHFGYWGGLVTKIIWFIMGLGISSLVLSGIWITLKRKAKQKKKRKLMGLWKYINWLVFVLMLFFMVLHLKSNYSASNYIITSICVVWISLIGLAYYVFIYQISKQTNTS